MNLAQALFTPAQASLLGWLFGEPERWFHVNELLRLTGLGSASLQRELARLDTSGLVDSDRVGNLRRFRANPDSPVFQELVALVRKTISVVPVLAAALGAAGDRIVWAAVFGSVAKQTDHADSDIDLMVVSDALTTGDIVALTLEAEKRLGRKINPTCYSLADFTRRRGQRDSFVNRVLSQPLMPLLGDIPGEALATSA